MHHHSITLLADSGSTKTDWCVVSGGKVAARVRGRGINPCLQGVDEIAGIVDVDLMPRIGLADGISAVYFYGAGCRDDKSAVVEGVLRRAFPEVAEVTVGSDMLGAARALFGNGEGIACILGTGANSCVYDGHGIVANIPPLGYILGDEGSGAVLGKLFINALFKGGLPGSLRDEFVAKTGYDVPHIINKVYGQPLANRFLASLSPFIHEHLDCDGLRRLVVYNFRAFFRRNVALYGRSDLPVGAVGSIAYHYGPELHEAAAAEGYAVTRVVKSPMDGLLAMAGVGAAGC